MITYCDPSVRFTGRWAQYRGAMTTTAPGAYFEIAFRGDSIRLHFDIGGNEHPRPHLFLELDGLCRSEAPLDQWLRVDCPHGEHILRVIYKGGKEIQPRFFLPLVGKISFLGYEAEGAAVLPADNRKIIEFVGDSITEGVLIDDHLRGEGLPEQDCRPTQDDVTAGYSWLTSQALNLRDYHMGYGAVGVTKGGCGGVPKAAEAYPWCFEGAPITHRADYIVINHGANDRGNPDKYIPEYEHLLDVIRQHQPQAKILCLSAFCGVYAEPLQEMVTRYNAAHGTDVAFVDGGNWEPAEPVHPRREGHQHIARELTPILKALWNV